MKNLFKLLSLLLLSPTLLAQVDHQSKQLAESVSEVTSHLPQTPQSVEELIKLEDNALDEICEDDLKNNPSCRGFAESILPDGKKEHGWRTMLEIKYMNVEGRERRSLAEANYVPMHMPASSEKDLTDGAALTEEATKIYNEWKQVDPNVQYADIRNQLILNQLTDPRFNTSNEHMAQKMKSYAESIQDPEEYLRLLSSIAGWIDYNFDRASFIQQEGAGKGIASPWQQMMGSFYGVCGDIHSMTAKMAEQKGWEAVTIGYAIEGMQHVTTAVVDPKNPDKIMLVNYGRYESIDVKDGKAINPAPSNEGWEEIGTQFRVFKNNKTGDNTGKMQQIALLDTPLGSFMKDLFKKDEHASRAMVSNQNYRSTKVGFEHDATKTKLKRDDQKLVVRDLEEGIMIYEGEVDNARIFGVAVSLNKYRKLYGYNKRTGLCEPRGSTYASYNLALNQIDMTQANLKNTYFAYISIKGGRVIPLYETPAFSLGGVIGWELDGFGSMYSDKEFLTTDGNFTTLVGVMADYQKKGTKIHAGVTLENVIGLKNQNLMNDFSALPSNLQLGFNALKFEANASQKLTPNTTLTTGGQFTGTRVGSQVILTTGIIHKNTSVMMSYQGTMKSIPIGNRLQTMNFLQNMNGPDGLKFMVRQNFSSRNGNFSGNVNGYYIQPIGSTMGAQVGAGASFNLFNGRKPSGRR